MDITINSRNFEIDQQVRRTIDQKLNSIERHLPGAVRATVEVGRESTRSQNDRFVVQATLEVGGSVLRGEQRASSIGGAINGVVDVLNRRVEKYKSHAYRSQRSRQNVPLRAQEAEEALQPAPSGDDPALESGDLVRLKRFHMKPMTSEDAAVQMELLGHSFYMFLNNESQEHNVIYVREDGNYGLIQPMTG